MNMITLLLAMKWVCVSSLPGTGFDFLQDEFHVSYASAQIQSLHLTDLLLLTGHLPADGGGVVTAKCQNETEAHNCSHSMQFSESWYPHPDESTNCRNVSASLDGQMRTGKATWSWCGVWVVREIIYDAGPSAGIIPAVLVPGPNRPPSPTPPPPPSPSACPNVFNQSACASMATGGDHTCTWCKSTDNVHQLCFTKGHTPEKDWSCNGDDVQSVLVI